MNQELLKQLLKDLQQLSFNLEKEKILREEDIVNILEKIKKIKELSL